MTKPLPIVDFGDTDIMSETLHWSSAAVYDLCVTRVAMITGSTFQDNNVVMSSC